MTRITFLLLLSLGFGDEVAFIAGVHKRISMMSASRLLLNQVWKFLLEKKEEAAAFRHAVLL